jgi:hypothetical protein
MTLTAFWQDGVGESMRLDPGEHRTFDIGTRSYKIPGIPLRLCAHFVTSPQALLISCRLEVPGLLALSAQRQTAV